LRVRGRDVETPDVLARELFGQAPQVVGVE
jgi:hypothetical protein